MGYVSTAPISLASSHTAVEHTGYNGSIDGYRLQALAGIALLTLLHHLTGVKVDMQIQFLQLPVALGQQKAKTIAQSVLSILQQFRQALSYNTDTFRKHQAILCQ